MRSNGKLNYGREHDNGWNKGDIFIFKWKKGNPSTSTNEKKGKELTNVKNNDQEHNDEEANETRKIKKKFKW